MNSKLQDVQDALEKVNQIGERRTELEIEQAELKTRIQTLTAAVSTGDTKSVNDLAIAKARTEVLPGELNSLGQTFLAAVGVLRETLTPLSQMVAQAYGAEFEQTKKQIREFLSGMIDEAYLVDQFTTQICTVAKRVKDMDFLNTRFSNISLTRTLEPKAIVSRAEDALKLLQNVG
jgi:hypothetical protein